MSGCFKWTARPCRNFFPPTAVGVLVCLVCLLYMTYILSAQCPSTIQRKEQFNPFSKGNIKQWYTARPGNSHILLIIRIFQSLPACIHHFYQRAHVFRMYGHFAHRRAYKRTYSGFGHLGILYNGISPIHMNHVGYAPIIKSPRFSANYIHPGSAMYHIRARTRTQLERVIPFFTFARCFLETTACKAMF